MKASIKQLRRLETEILEESGLVASRLHKETNESLCTKDQAQARGLELLEQGQARLEELISLRFVVRGVIGQFNDEMGINKRTAQIAEHEEIIKMTEHSLLSFGQVQVTSNWRNNDRLEYTVGISLDKEDELRKFVRVQKRAIQKLKDSCAGTNAQGTIELEAHVIEGLQEHGFID